MRCTPLIVALACSFAMAGCGQGTTSQGTLYTVQANRALQTYLPYSIEPVHNAAKAVLEVELGYTVDETALDAHEGVIRAHTALEHPVRVQTFKHGEHVTRVEVYVGSWGSEPIGRDILSKVESRLAAAPGRK
jgi:hypothetical protein